MCGPSEGTAWGYDGREGPAFWGELDPAWGVCRLGREQSPIDLRIRDLAVGGLAVEDPAVAAGDRPVGGFVVGDSATRDPAAEAVADVVAVAGDAAAGELVDASPAAARAAPPQRVQFDYRRARATIENTGHGIQVNPRPGSGIVLDGVRYELRQFHFHHESEHTVEGVRFALELHLVHESEDGALAVVGVLCQEGAPNVALAPVWAELPVRPSPARALAGEVDLPALLPANRAAWRYRGSLTTPPCTEGVAWSIFAEPLALSRDQIRAFAALYPNNFRPVQPLGDRALYRD